MKSTVEIVLTSITILVSSCVLRSLGFPNSKLQASELNAPLPSDNFLQYSLIPRYLNDFLNNGGQLEGISPSCLQDYDAWISEIKNNLNNLSKAKNWALQMIDAWGKPPEGVLSGHVEAMGDFDECLGVRGHTISESTFKGQYCTNYITFKTEGQDASESQTLLLDKSQDRRSIANLQNVLGAMAKSNSAMIPSIASCLPSSCSVPDTQIIVQAMFNSSQLTSSMIPITGICYTDEKPPLSAGSIAMISVLSLLGVFLVVGSTIDLWDREGFYRSNYKVVGILQAFSVPKNAGKLLNTTSPAGDMSCLHGIRFLSAFWVVLGHTFYMHVLQPLWNPVDIVEVPKESLISLFLVNGDVVVDTFLTLTGVLVTFSILKMLDKVGKLNVPLLYISRYLRLTPMYALLIGISATLLPYVSSGPQWVTVDMWAAFCRKTWWKNLLYINNLPIYNDTVPGSTDVMCFGESWYLGVDMQLFLISPLIIYPLWKWKRVGQLILLSSTVISIIIPVVVTYALDLLPTSIPFRASLEYTHQGYMPTWMRASPYMMGIWTGYFLYKTQANFKLYKITIISCWSIIIASSLALILGIQKYFDWNYEIPKVEGAIYAGFRHSVWGICTGWVIFACSRGYGGWLNRFLSWKGFIPLGRLTFAIYLVSFHLQFVLHFSYPQPIYYSAYNAVNLSFSHIVMSSLVAFVCSVTMEMPFVEISNIFLRKESGSGGNSRRPIYNESANGYRNYGAAITDELSRQPESSVPA